MPTPPMLHRREPALRPADPRQPYRPDPIASLSIGLLVLVMAGLLVLAVGATWSYVTWSAEGMAAEFTAAVFGAFLVIQIVGHSWRHFAGPGRGF